LLDVFVGAAAGAFVTGVFGLVVWALNRHAAKKDREYAEEREDDKKADDRLDRVEEAIEALITAERQSYYCRIKSLGKEYISRGEITTEEFEDFLALHKIYHDTLGGNGFLDALVKDVKYIKKV
jgi:hypothetical protein